MRELHIAEREAGQRLDRYLEKYLREAQKSFIYKMLRKKNIVLNGKKASGSELLAAGDAVRLWLAEETIAKFAGEGSGPESGASKISASKLGALRASGSKGGSSEGGEAKVGVVGLWDHAYTGISDSSGSEHQGQKKSWKNSDFSNPNNPKQPTLSDHSNYPVTDLEILYEDTHVLLVNKPAGMLSQKAKPTDVSLCEYLIGYLLHSGQITEADLRTVKPSVCNRLDRNTSGIVCCGKTAAGLAALSELLRTRRVGKYYLAWVMGTVEREERLEGLLLKDARRNTVQILGIPSGNYHATKGYREICDSARAGNTNEQQKSDQKEVCTVIRPLRRSIRCDRAFTLVEAELLTGRSHQIRAQLAAVGHTLVGDVKYASRKEEIFFRQKLHQTTQLLHCARMEFPVLEGALAGLSERVIEVEPGWNFLQT